MWTRSTAAAHCHAVHAHWLDACLLLAEVENRRQSVILVTCVGYADKALWTDCSREFRNFAEEIVPLQPRTLIGPIHYRAATLILIGRALAF